MEKNFNYIRNPNRAKILNENNNHPFNSKIGMVFTSHKGHMPYMKYALQQYRKIEDMFIIGAYDTRTVNPLSPRKNGFPYTDIWSRAHMWVTKHYTFGGHQKRHGWTWLHIYASAILKQFPNIEYIFSANGDCVWDKPEGVHEIIDILGDNDFMSGQSETRHTDGFNFIHSCTMIFKREAYFRFVDFMLERIQEAGTVGLNPESMLSQWVATGEVKWNHAPNQATYKTGEWKGHKDTYCEEGGPSTWRDVIGFHNLEAEKNWNCTHRLPPLQKKYFDLRDTQIYYNDHDKNTICKYYTTGDKRYIKMWWDQDPYSVPREERIKRMQKTIKDY